MLTFCVKKKSGWIGCFGTYQLSCRRWGAGYKPGALVNLPRVVFTLEVPLLITSPHAHVHAHAHREDSYPPTHRERERKRKKTYWKLMGNVRGLWRRLWRLIYACDLHPKPMVDHFRFDVCSCNKLMIVDNVVYSTGLLMLHSCFAVLLIGPEYIFLTSDAATVKCSRSEQA